MFPDNWNQMSPDEKMAFRFERWLSTEGQPFSPEGAEKYKRRLQRFIDIIQLNKPDRAPFFSAFGGIQADYSGITHGDFMYDYPKATKAILKFHQDFDPDYQSLGNFMAGKVYDRLDYQVYKWPGRSLPPEVAFQCIEGEYMNADEYDQLIADPESFYMRVYMPRVFKSLEGWSMLPTFWASMEMPMMPILMGPVTAPLVQEAFKSFLEASQLMLEYFKFAGETGGQLTFQMGMPNLMGGFSKAPFDWIGDTLRGTRGIMLDMYRQPDKVLAAVDRLVPLAIQMAVQASMGSNIPIIFIPLHKGADGFMSNADFEKFYWPSLKATMMGIINEGLIPLPFAEGGYNQRLDIIANDPLPAGKSAWWFDQTDIQVVKEKFGSWACIGGNIPASLFHAGTPQEMEAYVKNLIDSVGQDGGYFVAPGVVLDHSTPENLHTCIKTVREYGVYS